MILESLYYFYTSWYYFIVLIAFNLGRSCSNKLPIINAIYCLSGLFVYSIMSYEKFESIGTLKLKSQIAKKQEEIMNKQTELSRLEREYYRRHPRIQGGSSDF